MSTIQQQVEQQQSYGIHQQVGDLLLTIPPISSRMMFREENFHKADEPDWWDDTWAKVDVSDAFIREQLWNFRHGRSAYAIVHSSWKGCLTLDTKIFCRRDGVEDFTHRRIGDLLDSSIQIISIDPKTKRSVFATAFVEHSGIKKVFKLTTSYRRSITASEDHILFVMESGEIKEKKVSELVVGDELVRINMVILTGATRLKLMHERGVAVRWSADNPPPPPTIKGEKWHKTHDATVHGNILRKYNKAQKGKSLEERLGKKQSLTIRKAISDANSGEKNHNYGKITYPPLKYIPELGHNVRSIWEQKICAYLKKECVPYEYEPDVFHIVVDGKRKTYTPDIKLSDEWYIEVKGFAYDWQEEKMQAFLKQHPTKRLMIITDTPPKTHCYTLMIPYANFQEHLFINVPCPTAMTLLYIGQCKNCGIPFYYPSHNYRFGSREFCGKKCGDKYARTKWWIEHPEARKNKKLFGNDKPCTDEQRIQRSLRRLGKKFSITDKTLLEKKAKIWTKNMRERRSFIHTEKIKSITLLGEEPTADLKCPEFGNFVLSNGILSHNSAKSIAGMSLGVEWEGPTWNPRFRMRSHRADMIALLTEELKKFDVSKALMALMNDVNPITSKGLDVEKGYKKFIEIVDCPQEEGGRITLEDEQMGQKLFYEGIDLGNLKHHYKLALRGLEEEEKLYSKGQYIVPMPSLGVETRRTYVLDETSKESGQHSHTMAGRFRNILDILRVLKYDFVNVCLEVPSYASAFDYMLLPQLPIYYACDEEKVYAVKCQLNCKPPFQKGGGTDFHKVGNIFRYTPSQCFDKETEILTSDGWKRGIKLTEADIVASLDRYNDKVVFLKPRKIIKEPYQGPMYFRQGQCIDLLVTPNHNLYLGGWTRVSAKRTANSLPQTNKRFYPLKFYELAKELRNKQLTLVDVKKEIETRTGRNISISQIHKYSTDECQPWDKHIFNQFIFTKPAQIVGKRICFKTQAKIWEGLELSEFELPGYSYMLQKIQIKVPSKVIPMDEWLDFFGFWIAEGHADERRFTVSNNNSAILHHYHNLLTKWGLNSSFSKKKNCLWCCNKQAGLYLSQFGKSHQKYFPKWMKNLSTRQLKILMKAYLQGDGCLYDTEKMLGYASTVSKRLADDLQEITLKIGNSAIISETTDEGLTPQGIYWPGRPLYVVYFNSGGNKHKARISSIFKDGWVHYEGLVWCVNCPPHHLIYVRRNGKPMWSGNSLMRAYIALEKTPNVAAVISSGGEAGVQRRHELGKSHARLQNIGFDPEKLYQELINHKDWGGVRFKKQAKALLRMIYKGDIIDSLQMDEVITMVEMRHPNKFTMK